jgi:glycosyltransferase involved in cell wall biosynthesis
MKPQGILHVSTATSWRGGEQQLAYLFRELKTKGIEQTILCPEGSALANHCRFEKMRFQTYRKRSGLGFLLGQRLGRLANSLDVDLVTAHDSHAHSALINAASFFGLKKPSVVHRKVDFPVGGNSLSKRKYRHPAIAHYICVSEEVRNILSRVVEMDRMSVVYDGIDLNRFPTRSDFLRTHYSISPEKKLIGNVSALTAQKDPFTFLKTAAALKERGFNAHFFLIGEGELKREMMKRAADLGIQEEVTFTGFLDNIEEVLPSLDLLLFTSVKEGLGTTVLDAFSAGVPVVCTQAGGLNEIIEHGKNAYSAAVWDSDGLAKGVQWMFEEEGRIAEVTSSARSTVQAFSFEEMASKTLAVYRGLF